jgi:FMN phosphatase YigB (HAD superfamily)
MVGDDWEADILGANQAGLWAVWLNERSEETRNGPFTRTIHELSELSRTIESLA